MPPSVLGVRISRAKLLIGAIAVALAVAGGFAVAGGRTVPAGIWLQVDQDPSLTELHLLIFRRCSSEGEKVRSVTVEETDDSIVIEVWVSGPIFGGTMTSCEGMSYSVQLDEPLGERQVLKRNPDGTETPIRDNPFP
ncbi:MAG TPA: hypothetical protein VJR05_01640 [Acidimicrobiia bacterium]|nr:hypothetical protein [Acidimicrobiia bacterium]